MWLFCVSSHAIGLTGAPTTFSELISHCTHDMIGQELLLMDDVCLPGDDFDQQTKEPTKIFYSLSEEEGLSLSSTKTKLFFTDVLFASAMVRPSGIKPNLDKVAALSIGLNRRMFQDLMAFLGLLNYFADL